eukprot:TRINITY_DN57055_c0_g1_i3.p1 TRINITY_DN57055_c0_g1~~TRINITY_DN57055_c0_g1_i3.p1  ORF type:complete len:287 (-),score=55.76 TRINITY_DN57055_c0_g1_i3:120-980(-)
MRPSTGAPARQSPGSPGEPVALEDMMCDANPRVMVVAHPSHAAQAYSALYQSLAAGDRAVGVDCEGQGVADGWALMIQISSRSMVVVETAYQWAFSPQAQRLLGDSSIVKAFCGAGGDISALEFPVVNVVDIQESAAKVLACPKNQMPGLSQVLSWADPEKRAWSKQKFGARGWWRLRTPEAMLKADGFVQYAAADAWGTMQAYFWITAGERSGGGAALLKKERRRVPRSCPTKRKTADHLVVSDTQPHASLPDKPKASRNRERKRRRQKKNRICLLYTSPSPRDS